MMNTPTFINGQYLITENGEYKDSKNIFENACISAKDYSRRSLTPFIYSVYELIYKDNNCQWAHRRSWRNGQRLFSVNKQGMAAAA